MKHIFIYICCLLATILQPAIAQENVGTKAQPPYPTYPGKVICNTPANGNLRLAIQENEKLTPSTGAAIHAEALVALIATPDAGYQPVPGYPKAYMTGDEGITVSIVTDVTSKKPVFLMPAYSVTVEMMYEAIPTNDTRLKSISYQLNSGEAIPLSQSGEEQVVILPAGTSGTITLDATPVDGNASVTIAPSSITLPGEQEKATVTVTVKAADQATTKTFTIHFSLAPAQTKVINIPPVTGGTLIAYYTEGEKKVFIKSGDVVKENVTLTLEAAALPGYTFEKFTNNGTEVSGTTIAVSGINGILAAHFTKDQNADFTELGTEAVSSGTPDIPVPTKDTPIVVIPDAASMPADTELSELRLIKDENVPEVLQDEIKELATTSGIEAENVLITEITLVKIVTSIEGSTGKTTTELTPVQPASSIVVRIAYPEEVDKEKHDFIVFHLRTDGTTEIYSTSNGKLKLGNTYMELTISSFSPFGIAWKVKSTPTPPYVPNYYNVSLPATEGVTFDKKAQTYVIEEGYNFTFSFTLQEGYKLLSKPVVRTDRDEVILPRESDGKYIIPNVDRDITIHIEGILKDDGTPTSNIDATTSGIRAQVKGATLYIRTDRPEQVNLFTLTGKTLRRFTAPAGNSQYTLPPGIYLIRIGEQSLKAVVR